MFPPLSLLYSLCIQDMTKDQIANEKVALQKALLYYESIHGRPVCEYTEFFYWGELFGFRKESSMFSILHLSFPDVYTITTYFH